MACHYRELLKLIRRENSYEKWKVGVIGATTILKDKADIKHCLMSYTE